MRTLVIWAVRAVVFFLLFGLALKNSGPVDLYFFFDQHWQFPIALVLLVSCGLGIVLGLSAALTNSIRDRRS